MQPVFSEPEPIESVQTGDSPDPVEIDESLIADEPIDTTVDDGADPATPTMGDLDDLAASLDEIDATLERLDANGGDDDRH